MKFATMDALRLLGLIAFMIAWLGAAIPWFAMVYFGLRTWMERRDGLWRRHRPLPLMGSEPVGNASYTAAGIRYRKRCLYSVFAFVAFWGLGFIVGILTFPEG